MTKISTDGTRDILAAHKKVELRRFVRANSNSLELSKQAVQNECWKEAAGSADWVMIVDCDEHVFHPALTEYLSEQGRMGVTFIPTLGFNMVTEEFPTQGEHLASTRTIGYLDHRYSKPCIFDPTEILETNFTVGLHAARPIGRLNFTAQDEVNMLLHYKYLGLEYLAQRYSALALRRGAVDVANGWSSQFGAPVEQWRDELATVKDRLVNIAGRGFSPSAVHPIPLSHSRAQQFLP